MSFNYQTTIRLLAVIAVLCIAMSVIVTAASAITIGQMDDVYLGETVDLAQALAWPDYSIAWCSPSNYACDPPDQVIHITGFMHKYYIDPEVFHIGTYYRWSGQWNRGENAVAFYVKSGTRPIKNITTVTATPTPTPEPGVDVEGNGPFHYMITRGDSPDIKIHFTKDSEICGGGENRYDGKLWLFGLSKMLLDQPLRRDENSDYWFEMKSGDTAALDAGDYTGYLQFTGKNGLQDVFRSGSCFDSPYDDKIVPNVDIDFTNPSKTKSDFETIVKSAKYSDDLLIPITMEIREPEIIVEDIVQGEDTIWVGGRTTWSNETVITFKMDPDNYALAQDIRLHTWNTRAVGPITDYRRFNIAIPYVEEEMYIGIHELKMSVDKNGYLSDVYYDFRVTGLYVMPTPTPTFKKYLTDINGSPLVTTVPTITVTEATPIPTITQIIVATEVNLTPVATIETPNWTEYNITHNVTTVPTPMPPPPTYDANITLPGFPWWIAVVAFGFAWWRLR